MTMMAILQNQLHNVGQNLILSQRRDIEREDNAFIEVFDIEDKASIHFVDREDDASIRGADRKDNASLKEVDREVEDSIQGMDREDNSSIHDVNIEDNDSIQDFDIKDEAPIHDVDIEDNSSRHGVVDAQTLHSARCLWLVVAVLVSGVPQLTLAGDPSVGPCNSNVLINDENRFEKTCYSPFEYQWFRFQRNEVNAKIATACPSETKCSSNFPLWIKVNGTHPAEAQEKEVLLCARIDGECCLWSNLARVRNCGDFYVYKLMPAPACNWRYCYHQDGGAKRASSSAATSLLLQSPVFMAPSVVIGLIVVFM